MSSEFSANGSKNICQLCGYQTIHKTHLNLHEQEVHDRKRFQCQECAYQATKKNHLVTQQKSVHIGQTF